MSFTYGFEKYSKLNKCFVIPTNKRCTRRQVFYPFLSDRFMTVKELSTTTLSHQFNQCLRSKLDIRNSLGSLLKIWTKLIYKNVSKKEWSF